MFKLLTTKNFILLKNDKIYQTTKFFKQRKIDLVLSGRTGTKLKIFQLFVKIVMFYYIFIIFKRQKKWTILFLWFFTWYCLIVSRETFICWFRAIARVFCRFLFHVKQYQIGGIRRDCFAHRLGTGVAREIDVYI